jgi:polyhydroxyalkanoate synthesis regulator phasin
MTRKTATSRRPVATTPTARNVWLASLGAISLVRKQGEKLVTVLVEEGQAIQARTDRLRNRVAEDVRRQVKRQDVADLTARVTSLGSKVKARNAKATARRRPATRRKPVAKRA